MRIPLRSADGEQRFALVDANTFALLGSLRWQFKDRYVQRSVRIGGRIYNDRLHRIVLGLARGDPRMGEHIDRDPLNNQRANLRIVASQRANMQNRSASGQAGSSSQYRGVSWDQGTGRWKAQVMLDGINNYLGLFDDEGEAARVAAAWRSEHMPFSVEPLVSL